MDDHSPWSVAMRHPVSPEGPEEQRIVVVADGLATEVRIRWSSGFPWIEVVPFGVVCVLGTVGLIDSVVRRPGTAHVAILSLLLLLVLVVGAVIQWLYHLHGVERWRFTADALVVETGVRKLWRRRSFDRAEIGEWQVWKRRPMPERRRLPTDIGSVGTVVFRHGKRRIHLGYALHGDEADVLLRELAARGLITLSTTPNSRAEGFLAALRGV
jgi:hypothetical protein